MKKILFFIIFIFLLLTLTADVKEPKKIYKLKKAYIYMDEELLISDADLNCSYFFRDGMPQDIRIIASYQPVDLRLDFSDGDNLFIDKGSQDGLKKGDLLLIIGRGKSVKNLGHCYLKKSLAEITDIYEQRSIIRLQSGCNPVHVGDFAILHKPGKTLFAKKIDYMLARIPANPVSGNIVYTNLSLDIPATISGTSQYITVDLGQGVVAKGTLMLIYRILKNDLPPLIIGSGIVIQAENTNSTVKILDSNSDIKINDRVFILPAGMEKDADAGAGEKESIPIMDTLEIEGQGTEDALPGETRLPEEKADTLTMDILFGFDSKRPLGDHSADYQAIKEFIEAKAEYLITLRGYTCSIGREEYNLRLAKQRVEGIRDILISQCGADPAHVEMFFYGEKESLFDNSSEAERLKNRLVKIEVSGK